jgi:hypothetical protein
LSRPAQQAITFREAPAEFFWVQPSISADASIWLVFDDDLLSAISRQRNWFWLGHGVAAPA